MLPRTVWTDSLTEYLLKVVPERFSSLIQAGQGAVYSSSDIAGLQSRQFREFQPTSMEESLEQLILTIRFLFPSHEILIDDFNFPSADSSISSVDSTHYLAMTSQASDAEMMERINDCSSWRWFGLIFSEDRSRFGMYVGAFDDQGFLLTVFDHLSPAEIESIFQETLA